MTSTPITKVHTEGVTFIRELWVPGSREVNSKPHTRGSVNPAGNPKPAENGNSTRGRDPFMHSTVHQARGLQRQILEESGTEDEHGHILTRG